MLLVYVLNILYFLSLLRLYYIAMLCSRLCQLGLCKYTVWCSPNGNITQRYVSKSLFLSLSIAWLYSWTYIYPSVPDSSLLKYHFTLRQRTGTKTPKWAGLAHSSFSGCIFKSSIDSLTKVTHISWRWADITVDTSLHLPDCVFPLLRHFFRRQNNHAITIMPIIT